MPNNTPCWNPGAMPSDTSEAKQLPKLQRVKTEREKLLEQAAKSAVAILEAAGGILIKESYYTAADKCNQVQGELQQALNESGE